MRYCSRCILPDTRPALQIGPDGVCSACRAHTERRQSVDWPRREKEFKALVESVRRRTGRGYDCVIPVSGGKDSTWQVVVALQHGLNPLAVTWKPPARTEIGRQNLENLIRLGVDHIDFQINPEVERKFLLKSLARLGSTAIPMHLALFSIPLSIAVRWEVPLVIWGENSADEYVGEGAQGRGAVLDASWIKRYGVTQGTTAKDWVSEELTEKELTPYFAPSPEELRALGVLAIFLGHYFRWDPATSLEVAKAHGFRVRQAGPKTGYYPYADIDDDFISIHHFLKWYKFGFTRTFDNLSLEIRNGRVTREEALRILRERGDETPHEDIAGFCHFVGITVESFFEMVEPFRNREIWIPENGSWRLKDFLIPDWNWQRHAAYTH